MMVFSCQWKHLNLKYDEIYGALKDGSIQVANDTAADDASKLPVEVVTVESIK